MESSAHFVRRLRMATRDCRPDMHEPDQLETILKGDHLDNAMPPTPARHGGEYLLGLKTPEGHYEWFNLATMIAILKNQGGL